MKKVLNKLTVAELRGIAKKKNIRVPGRMKKQNIIKLIRGEKIIRRNKKPLTAVGRPNEFIISNINLDKILKENKVSINSKDILNPFDYGIKHRRAIALYFEFAALLTHTKLYRKEFMISYLLLFKQINGLFMLEEEFDPNDPSKFFLRGQKGEYQNPKYSKHNTQIKVVFDMLKEFGLTVQALNKIEYNEESVSATKEFLTKMEKYLVKK